MIRYFVDKYSAAARPRVLDVGCGTGLLLKELGGSCDAWGIDFSPLAINFCKERGLSNVSQGSATNMGFPNDSYDVILLLDVLEHIEDDAAVVREIHRVLKPGGLGIIFVPAFNFLWGITDVSSKHFRRYTLPQLSSLFAKEGFEIARATYFNFLLFVPIFLVRSVVKLFNIQIVSEFEANNAFVNGILYSIFDLEFHLLKVTDLPFGVSVCVIVRKKQYDDGHP